MKKISYIRLGLYGLLGISLFYLLANMSVQYANLSDFKKIEGGVYHAVVKEYIERVAQGVHSERMRIDLYLKGNDEPVELKGIPQEQVIGIKTEINRNEHIEVYYREDYRGFFQGTDIDVVQINGDDSVLFSLEESKKLRTSAIKQFIVLLTFALVGLAATYWSSKLKELISSL